ncbi:MAG TPA: hypothetical protein VJ242_00345 [Patescibacteria group bacterium]|nr:hypothetical protein [Patescibacteria group bacterium]
MSKKLRLIIAVILVVLLAAGLFWYFKTQNPNSGLVQKEISIQEAGIGSSNYLTHDNFAGFSFQYPDNMTLKETELENPAVYASVELDAASGETISLRIYDDRFADTDEWLNVFEANNVIVDMSNVLWADIPAKSFATGTPQKLYTVAIDEGVVYRLESPISSSFLREAHEHLISSFQFTQESTIGNQTQTAPEESEDAYITLIEEIIQ